MKTTIQGVRQLTLSLLRITTAVLMGVVLSAQFCEAATYYVAKNGNDSSPGTEVQPFLTISRGVSNLKAGDTLYVKNGTYAESLREKIPSGTSWDNPVTVSAYPGHQPVIKPPDNSHSMVLKFFGDNRGPGGCCLIDSYIIVNGFVLDGANVEFYVVKISAGSHHIRLTNLEVRNSPKSCMQTTENADFNEFIRIKAHNCGGTGTTSFGSNSHGFYISSHNNLVEFSEIYQNSGACIQNKGNENIYRNNFCHGNGTGATFSCGSLCGTNTVEFNLGNGARTQIYNNIFYNTHGGININNFAGGTTIRNNTFYGFKDEGIFSVNGIMVKADAGPGITIENNIIQRGTGGFLEYGIRIYEGAINAVVKNNIVFNNSRGSAGVHFHAGQGELISGNIYSDPLMVDPDNQQFSLQPSSPAIDAGTSVNTETDYAGTLRPQGFAYDIGAYEFGAEAPSSPSNLLVTPSP